ncbi:MAG: 50S ribosomal protein L21 [Lachnospiraceae bacterium]|nr:50S ribosomal protein L21 [Lachnospiraceae bacterium]
MYAIIATGGKQYKVAEGDLVWVEKLPGEVGDSVTFDQVLVVSGDDFKVGEPMIAGASVEATIEAQKRDKKVIVYRYKPKKGYHKKNGHRQSYTSVKITKINA